MTPAGDIHVENLRNLLQFHLKEGTDNLCILGTTAESSVMSMAERELVLKTTVEEVKGKIPILAGTGTLNPNTVKTMTQQAIDLGADACLVVSPYYVKPPQRGLIRHFTTIADLGLPLVIYNIPGRTGIDFLDENIAICAEHEKIVGVKDATGKLERVEALRSLVADDFLLYSGDDATSLEFCLRGGDGCISVTANLVPKAMHAVMAAAIERRADDANDHNAPLLGLHQKLFVESNPIPVKWCAKRLGLIDSPYCRPPLDELDPKFAPVLEDVLKSAGLLS